MSAFPHADNSERMRIVDLPLRDAYPVVHDFQTHFFLIFGQCHPALSGFGVPRYIGERFLKNTEDCCRQFFFYNTFAATDIRLTANTGPFLKIARLPFDAASVGGTLPSLLQAALSVQVFVLEVHGG